MAENPLQEFSQEQQPYSMEAEQSVLGAILLEPECIAQVLEYLSPESFYRQQHKELFAIMLAMFTSAQPIDVVTVLEQAKKDRVFPGENEAKVYLTQLAQTVPSIINVESYAKVVQEKYYLRSLIGIARNIISHSTDGDSTARNLMEFAEHKLFELRQGKDSGGLVRVDRAIYELYDHLQRLSGEDKDAFAGISTGFSALDQVTTGLNRSDLILLAARPAMGKSTFAFNIAANVAKQGKTVAFADIAYANGGDPELFSLLKQAGLLWKLGGYAGWNTSSNTLGTAIPMAMLRHCCGPRKEHLDFLALRYLEDIGYMAEVRNAVCREELEKHGWNYFEVDGTDGEAARIVRNRLEAFAERELPFPGHRIRITECRLPWNRMFEIGLKVSVISEED